MMRRALLGLLLGWRLASPAAAAEGVDPLLASVASEARETIAVLDWFYVQHRACPQPAQPAELAELQSGLGDGFSVDRQGQFVAIRGISMADVWFYYASPDHPDRCTLWRKLGWDPALIWRRRGNSTGWVLDPGDGTAERPLKLAP